MHKNIFYTLLLGIVVFVVIYYLMKMTGCEHFRTSAEMFTIPIAISCVGMACYYFYCMYKNKSLVEEDEFSEYEETSKKSLDAFGDAPDF